MGKDIMLRDEFLYQQIADGIESQILSGVVAAGDKLPSVRVLSKEQGVSVSTVLQAFYHLESKGLIESRPQSGYYVRFNGARQPLLPSKSYPQAIPQDIDAEDMIQRVFQNMHDTSFVHLEVGVPAPELLPLAKLAKGVTGAVRTLDAGGTCYENLQGNLNLRKQIARWSVMWNGRLTPDDIVTTSGCMNSLSYALLAVTERGDTIAVESPIYLGILQLAKSLGLKVLELPTDPVTGIEVEALKAALERNKINACLVVTNFSNPTGSCIPDENKKHIVELLEKHQIPLIEDDLYGDVYFSPSRPKSCKTYDESGIVLWCGSVSKTLAPGYRVGWIAPGKYLDKVKKLKLYHTVATTTLTHEVVANFLENGRYEHHLRKLRQVLHGNSLRFIQAIGDHFPEGTKVTCPRGGFMLWVELNKGIDTYELHRRLNQEKISIAPGRMFTLQDQYTHCMRLSYGMKWTPEVEAALQKVGRHASKMA
ncbi:aminotransferase-like domain-containing protein [Telluribacter humicola]|uniref:aminotransferase-like domain-containing protein n=1 Tax=Telluribacter humicola TaxID=1720261 RepID=UPI001A95E60C|nr:PLP-dependent aminotransferase family protein [Telluribacter humicola]